MTPTEMTRTDPTAEATRLSREMTTLRRQLEDAEQRARPTVVGTLVAPESRRQREAREEAFDLRGRLAEVSRRRDEVRVQVTAQVDAEARPARLTQVAQVAALAEQLEQALIALVELDRGTVQAGGTRPDPVLGAFVPTWRVERERLQRAGWFPGARVDG